MFEEYYIQVLEYLKTTDEVNPDKMDMGIPKEIKWASIEEMGTIGLVILGKYHVEINEKGKAYLLIDRLPKNMPINTHIVPHDKNNHNGTVLSKIFKYIINKILLILFWLFITVVGGLLIYCVLNYWHHKGFTL